MLLRNVASLSEMEVSEEQEVEFGKRACNRETANAGLKRETAYVLLLQLFPSSDTKLIKTTNYQ